MEKNILLSIAFHFVAICSLLGQSSTGGVLVIKGAERDSVLATARAKLDSNLVHLSKVQYDAARYKLDFLDMRAMHPCDVCDVVKPIPVEEYAFEVAHGVHGFVHSVVERHARVFKHEDGHWVVHLPYTQGLLRVDGSKDVKTGRRSMDLEAVVHLGAVPDDVRIITIEAIEPTGEPMTMLELLAGVGVGQRDFGTVLQLSPAGSESRVGIGMVRYVSPIGHLNRSRAWLKYGFRLERTTSILRQDLLGYQRLDVQLDPEATNMPEYTYEIDMRWRVKGLEERITHWSLLLPVGLSKRVTLGERMELNIEAELGLAYRFQGNVTGRYNMDQHGDRHRINGQVMLAGDYTGPIEAVQAEDGVVYRMFSDEQYVLDDLSSEGGLFVQYAFRPGLLFKGRDGAVRYIISVDLVMAGRDPASNAVLNERYFLDPTDEGRPPLGSLDRRKHNTYIGLSAAIKL